MNDTRRFALLAVTAMMTAVLPCVAQDQDNSQSTPDLSGTGNAGRVAVWKDSTTLTNSVISQSSGSIGIGTETPGATLEVNGNARVDGNFIVGGSILPRGAGTLIWASRYALGNFRAGLGALPTSAGGIYSTAVGDFALSKNSSGSVNTAVGVDALFANTSGNYNTAIGASASNGNTTGSFNIAIGANAGTNLTSTSNNIHIGHQGTATDSGTIRIGTPFVGGCTTCQSSAFIAGIYGQSTGLAGAPVVVDSNGNLGTMSSSRRYKENINDMGDASDGLMQLRPVTFRYKTAYEDGSRPVQFGLIAEEVAEVYPDLVARTADGQVDSVRYQLLDPMLLNELQKQHATIAAQKEQIRSLEERLARVEAMLTAGATGATGQ